MAQHLVPVSSSGVPLSIFSFTSGGAALDFDLGFLPDFAIVVNENAAAGEVSTVIWTRTMGDSKALNLVKIADNGSTGNTTPAFVSSGGSITQKNTGATVQTSEPVKVYAQTGITIAAAFMDDGDVIHVIAGRGNYKAFGDLGA